MVLIAPQNNWWMAFNPETCAMHKVWQGKLDFRGKVWDFSQDNSRADGKILFAAPSEMWRLPDGPELPATWSSQGVAFDKDGWSFAAKSFLRSPVFDASQWQRVFVAFDETGVPARFHVGVTDDGGSQVLQWFDSATSVTGPKDWQWNFKRIERPMSRMRVQFSTEAAKRLRNLRMYGDKPSWFGMDGQPLEVHWRGYETVKQTQAVVLRYDLNLKGGTKVQVTHRPDRWQSGWKETITLSGLPTGQEVYLRREGLSQAIGVTSNPDFAKGHWTLSHNGTFEFKFSQRTP